MQKRLAAMLLRAVGWRAEAPASLPDRCVIVAAPHTSNWDLPLMLLFGWLYGLRPRFMMKHTVFVGPAGWLFRRLGGIAIDRRRPGGVVAQMAQALAREQRLALVVPPEGTRERVDVWKSGFHRIAHEAGVPIQLSFLDYARRRGGFGPAFLPSDDLHADMERIRAYYDGVTPRYPSQFGAIRLAEEKPDATLDSLDPDLDPGGEAADPPQRSTSIR